MNPTQAVQTAIVRNGVNVSDANLRTGACSTTHRPVFQQSSRSADRDGKSVAAVSGNLSASWRLESRR